MHHNSLFNQPRIKLSLLYAGVMGAILLSLGYITHRVMEKSTSRSIDRELHLVATTLNSRLVAGLQIPGQLPSNANQILPELCLAHQSCQPKIQDSVLLQLVQEDYYLQLLDLRGTPIAAIGEAPNRFPANPDLRESYTVVDPKGDAYHLHLMPLQTQKGQLWGYLQVGRSVQKFEDYMRGLHLLILFGVPLAIARLDATPAPSSWAEICLNDLVQDLEEELVAFAMATGVDLSSQITTNENLYIDGNIDQIYRLISNLINNAIQHNIKNGKVLIKLSKSQNEAVIEIQDHGDGIAAVDLPQLFDRFYRIESDRNRQTGGAGLGLAISWAIARSVRAVRLRCGSRFYAIA
jgi:Histidine kinase-, DNA gyrase B-, and HSP90-like ATPase